MSNVIPVKTRRFAVGLINFFDHELYIEIHYANDWQDAILSHSKLQGADDKDYFSQFASLEEAKHGAFDIDSMIDVVEIPSA